MGLEGLFSRESSLAEPTSDGALGLCALLDKRGDFLKLGASAFLEVLHVDFAGLVWLSLLMWSLGRPDSF